MIRNVKRNQFERIVYNCKTFLFSKMKSENGHSELARNAKIQWRFDSNQITPNMSRNSNSSSTYLESPSSPSGHPFSRTSSRQQALASLQSLCSRAVMESNSKFTANSFRQLFSKSVGCKFSLRIVHLLKVILY